MLRTVRTLLGRDRTRAREPARISRPPRRARPRLEPLEPKEVPATLTWVGPDGGLWSDPGNWDLALAPAAGDDLVFDGAVADTGSTDDMAGLSVNSVTVTGTFTSTILIPDVRLTVTDDFVVGGGKVQIYEMIGDGLNTGVSVADQFTFASGATLHIVSGGDIVEFSAADLVLAAGSTFLVDGGTRMNSFTGDVDQSGTLTFMHPTGFVANGAYHLAPSGVINLTPYANCVMRVNGPTPMLAEGTINISVGSTLGCTSGVVLSTAAPNVATLNVTGSGTIDGKLTLDGSSLVHLLTSQTRLYVTGDYWQISGELRVIIGGGISYLEVGGTARFDFLPTATLRVVANGSYYPPQTYVIVRANYHEGSWDQLVLPPPPVYPPYPMPGMPPMTIPWNPRWEVEPNGKHIFRIQ